MKKIITLFAIGFFVIPIPAQEVGLQLYSLRNQFKEDVTESLDIIQSWGITKLEGGGTYGMSMENFQKELASRNLSVVSVGAGFEDLEKDPQKIIENAKAFGAKYAMCAWVPHDDNKWDLEETQHATEVFNKAGKILKENGILMLPCTNDEK